MPSFGRDEVLAEQIQYRCPHGSGEMGWAGVRAYDEACVVNKFSKVGDVGRNHG